MQSGNAMESASHLLHPELEIARVLQVSSGAKHSPLSAKCCPKLFPKYWYQFVHGFWIVLDTQAASLRTIRADVQRMLVHHDDTVVVYKGQY